MPEPGDTVYLTQPASGMPAGAEGTLIGWYVHEEPLALVRFEDGAALRVLADAIASPEDLPCHAL